MSVLSALLRIGLLERQPRQVDVVARNRVTQWFGLVIVAVLLSGAASADGGGTRDGYARVVLPVISSTCELDRRQSSSL